MTEYITDSQRENIESRIRLLGLKKSYVADRMGIEGVRFSQIMARKRKIQPHESAQLLKLLGLQN